MIKEIAMMIALGISIILIGMKASKERHDDDDHLHGAGGAA